MKKILLFIVLSTITFVLSANLSAKENYYAGYKRIGIDSESFDEIPVSVWFPTKQPSEEERFGPFRLNIALGAKLAKSKFPLVIISHGSGGSILGHRDTAELLAEQGYIVAALSHPRNNVQDNEDEATTANWENRPKHVSEILDKILQHRKFAKHIDPSKIAIIGHSAGGYTALTLLGGVPDTKQSRLHCQNKRQQDQGYCKLGNGKENQHKDLKIQGLADQRFQAGVLLAPVGILFADPKSLAKVNAPILLYRAEFDQQLNYPFHAQQIAKNLPKSSNLTYLILKNANHFSFIAPFPKSIAQEVGLPAQDKPNFDRKKAHQKINANILNFLNKTLR